MTTRLAVLGSPILHSRSPRIHQAAYEALNLPWSYEAIEVKPDDFAAFFSDLDDSWRGFSVTMPLKRSAFEFADTHDAPSAATGVVNTLLRSAEGWSGYNTDIPGIEASLAHLKRVNRATILGAGATSLSVAFALARKGVENLTVSARREEQGLDLVRNLTKAISSQAGLTLPTIDFQELRPDSSFDLFRDTNTNEDSISHLLVNTLPGNVSNNLVFSDSFISHSVLFDVTYDPYPSPLTEKWHAYSMPAIDGLELLVQQALIQVRIFTQGDAEYVVPIEEHLLAVMRAASVER